MLILSGLKLQQGEFSLTADLSITKGQKVAIVGPSGAGKSTLLNAIAGFIDPSNGRVVFDGNDVTPNAPGDRPFSILFQDNNLFPHLTVWQNVALGISPSLKLTQPDEALVWQALAKVGLSDLQDRKPAALSGGQQSRVALARVLVRGKPVILLDEPFSALGPALKDEMLDLVASLADETGAMLLMVTHDPDDAKRITDKTILVADGKARPPVETQELFANPPDILREYLGQ